MKERTVAVYARVSTEHEAQLSALENQVQYYGNILELHPEWKLFQYYIDEGITGTSVNKRKNFMQMMDDAKDGRFDLIITREVSRFARNTVDTLQQTRILKKYGVEVYFTDDNIWTMNDDDGELRLTIMATLAQNESKKTSMRVKAGQMVSFQNAVPYGNGNILGYERVGKEFVINRKQAETVRAIFDLYLSGCGMRKIQFELEKKGYRTSTGLTSWNSSTISRILNNPFYCGTIVYRKQYVPDYLEQKKIKNYDYVDKVVVEGTHDPIVTKEEFQKVQEILTAKTAHKDNVGARGKHTANDVWVKKMKCICGHTFNRKVWHRTRDGTPQFAYQCYHQIKTGTVSVRKKKGLSIDGVCDVPMIPAWKLKVMANYIFDTFWEDREGVLKLANKMLEDHINDDVEQDFEKEIKSLNRQISKNQSKIDNLVEMRMGDEITKEVFLNKKKILEEKIEALQEQLSQYKIEEDVSDEDISRKLEVLKYGLEQDFDFSNHSVPEPVLDAFVDEILVCKDCFVFKLSFTDESLMCMIKKGKKGEADLTTETVEVTEGETPANVSCSTGSYSKQLEQIGVYHIKNKKAVGL